jgi:hypothetical protein
VLKRQFVAAFEMLFSDRPIFCFSGGPASVEKTQLVSEITSEQFVL